MGEGPLRHLPGEDRSRGLPGYLTKRRLRCPAYQSFGRTRAAAGGDGGSGRAITLAGCWAPARRGFYEAKDQALRQATFILRQIGRFFKIEEERSRQPNTGVQQAAESNEDKRTESLPKDAEKTIEDEPLWRS